ncbi:hypothetical protein [Nocardiopsis sp. CA-288880]|uniref:hypothetical protein n=1 Tax=Nocardiopsis sp. CA-288880 TaxID=3239995 RepID=UPI003D976DCA
MRSRSILAVAFAVVLAVGCTSDEEAPADEGMEGTEEYEEPDTEMDDGTAELGSTHDFGDGVTIAMVDLRREVAEDAYNPTTGEDGALPYVAWSWELTNGTGAPLQLGGMTGTCHVGDPLEEVEQPHLGQSLNPPDRLSSGQTATWEADCFMNEDETALQYTLELYDLDSVPLYSVTFAGDVP